MGTYKICRNDRIKNDHVKKWPREKQKKLVDNNSVYLPHF